MKRVCCLVEEREREGDSAKRELRPFCCAEITPWGLCESSFPTHLAASGLMLRRRFDFYSENTRLRTPQYLCAHYAPHPPSLFVLFFLLL